MFPVGIESTDVANYTLAGDHIVNKKSDGVDSDSFNTCNSAGVSESSDYFGDYFDSKLIANTEINPLNGFYYASF